MAARIFRYTMLLSIVIPSTCVLPGYFSLPAHAERDDIIDHFFHLGLGYSEILMCLFLLHGICLLFGYLIQGQQYREESCFKGTITTVKSSFIPWQLPIHSQNITVVPSSFPFLTSIHLEIDIIDFEVMQLSNNLTCKLGV